MSQKVTLLSLKSITIACNGRDLSPTVNCNRLMMTMMFVRSTVT